MLLGLLHDLAKRPDLALFTTCSSDEIAREISQMPQVRCRSVTSSNEERTVIEEWGPQLDAALVIAPEFDGILQNRCHWLRSLGLRLLNADETALELASDKLKTDQICREHQIPTIPTCTVSQCDQRQPPWLPLVVKLRDGAGSLEMEILTSEEQWRTFCRRTDRDRFLVQPYLAGRSLSVSGLLEEGVVRHLFPIGEQLFSRSDPVSYVGGKIPARDVPEQAIHQLVTQTARALPGLSGWTGFDILLPETSPQSPLLIEVNPRLTTSSLGYRAVCQENLGNWILNPRREPSPTFQGTVTFSASGEFSVSGDGLTSGAMETVRR